MAESKYEARTYEILNEDKLDEILESFIEGGNPKKTLEELTEKLHQDLGRIIRNYFRNARIISNIPKSLRGYLSEYRRIGFDSQDLERSVTTSNEKIVYAPQQFLNNLAGVTNGRVLGAYDRATDTIYILDSLMGESHDEVLYHERYHREHPHASEPETRKATARAGYNQFQGVYN